MIIALIALLAGVLVLELVRVLYARAAAHKDSAHDGLDQDADLLGPEMAGHFFHNGAASK